MKPTIIIYSNTKLESQKIKTELIEKVKDRSIEIVDEHVKADYIISIGGDGTLLSAFHHFKHYLNHSKFLGIHTGHLGFYTDWLNNEVDQVLDGIESSYDKYVSYPLLDVEICLKDGRCRRMLALNEFSIRSTMGTMVSDVYVRDYFFETFRGDGISISTPTGSTGLNKSLGGAVVHPRLDAIQLTEMASINNRVYRTLSSPMIIPSDEWFTLKPDMTQSVILSVDNQSWQNYEVSHVNCRVAKERIKFASFRHTHFWDRVENAFIGRKNKDDFKGDL